MRKVYTEQNKKPYGKGHGYGGFANHSFTKEEYDSLEEGKNVRIEGVRLKSQPGYLFGVTLHYDGKTDKAGRKQYTPSDWERLGPDDKYSPKSEETEDKAVAPVKEATEEVSVKKDYASRSATRFDALDEEVVTDMYSRLSVEEAAELSDEEISEMARIAQEYSEYRDL